MNPPSSRPTSEAEEEKSAPLQSIGRIARVEVEAEEEAKEPQAEDEEEKLNWKVNLCRRAASCQIAGAQEAEWPTKLEQEIKRPKMRRKKRRRKSPAWPPSGGVAVNEVERARGSRHWRRRGRVLWPAAGCCRCCDRPLQVPLKCLFYLTLSLYCSISLGLCLIDLKAAAAAAAAGITSTASEQGEGLTLGGRAAADQTNSAAADWPLKHLDQIKQEAKVSAIVGQNVVLNCAVQFDDGHEKPFVVNWLKYPNKLPIYIWYAGYPPHVAQGYESRVARVGQASLNLSSVRPNDRGLYECKIYYLQDRKPAGVAPVGDGEHHREAQQQQQQQQSNGTWIYLDVQAPPRFALLPAPVSYVQAGDSLRLQCAAQSTPAPILRWYKNKLPIDSDSGAYRLLEVASGGSNAGDQHQLDLFIDNVQAGHTTGDYLCLASNSEGTIEARAQVQLAVPAVITSLPKDQLKLEGERAEFQCQAKALPANVTYRWLFNGKPIQSVQWFESRHSQRRDGTLVLAAVHRDDQGEFKCQATNGLAHRSAQSGCCSGDSAANSSSSSSSSSSTIYAEAAAKLRVEFPARVTHSPNVQFLPDKLEGQIRCFVEASPPVQFFTWTHNNLEFDPNADPNVERLHNGSLLIKSVTKKYEGKYRCTPFNKHGSAGSSGAMEVRVEEPPTFSLRPADFYKANLNGKVKIPCDSKLAAAGSRPKISWRRVIAAGAAPPQTSTSTSTSTPLPLQPPASSHLRSPEEAAADGLIWRHQMRDRRHPQAHMAYDEANDEPDETNHFYSTTTMGSSGGSLADPSLEQQQPEPEPDTDTGTTNSSQQQQQQPPPPPSAAQHNEAQVAQVTYAKLPSDRSEYKNGYLYLHNLRKEDHGRYECVLENEVATLVAGTMLYIEETTPHAPTDLRVDTKVWSARVSWTAGYDGGFEQSFAVWYRQVDKRQPTGGELIDVNWHSIQVEAGESNSVVVANLSQDTSYEFYVRAKNIIGESPRSEIVQAATQRALAGVVAPAANSEAELEVEPNQRNSAAATTIRPYLIIHPEFVPNKKTDATATTETSAAHSQQLETNSADSTPPPQVVANGPSGSSGANNATDKVITIYFPAKQQQHQTLADSTTQTQAPPAGDSSSAVQNLSMSKVAQGWVLSWSAGSSAQWAHSQLQLQQPQAAASSSDQQQQQQQQPPPPTSVRNQPAATPIEHPIAYSVEFRDQSGAKSNTNTNSGGWHTLALSKEPSVLLKDLRPGAAYGFRVLAHNSLGLKGPASAEFVYQIPDNRRKPGSAQALSAGVVSGILFFIACIVIAVCGVNMCNQRRKRRAEKAAYVMMACPVLESQHDIAALNSNSLMKNSASPAQDRVSSLAQVQLESSSDLVRVARTLKGLFRRNFSLSSSAAAAKNTARRRPLEIIVHPKAAAANQQQQQQQQLQTTESHREINFSSNSPLPVDVPDAPTRRRGTSSGQLNSPTSTTEATCTQVQVNVSKTTDRSQDKSSSLDDYWIRPPADRKWATLTVAASHAAQRQRMAAAAKEAAARTLPRPSGQATPIQAHRRSVSELEPAARYFFTPHKQQQQHADLDWLNMSFGPPAPPPVEQQPEQQLQLYLSQLAAAANESPGRRLAAGATWSSWAPPVGQTSASSPAAGHCTSMGQRNSLARSTLPVAWPQPPVAPPMSAAVNQLDDDPVTANACFGSYKRKRRLPHIEAKFTMVAPRGHEAATRTSVDPQQQQSGAAGLFVRQVGVSAPSVGQRREQARLRLEQRRNFAQLRTMDAREKIETYLRHQEQQQLAAAAAGCFSDSSLSSPTTGIELEQVDELSFQPYYNLPQLRYKVPLRLGRATDGRLLLKATPQVRPRSRASGRGSRRGSDLTAAPPVPPHRSHVIYDQVDDEQQQQQQQRRQLERRRRQLLATAAASSRCSSSTPPDETTGADEELSGLTSTSELSTARPTTRRTVGRSQSNGADQSTCDENYEFDWLSSSSSTARKPAGVAVAAPPPPPPPPAPRRRHQSAGQTQVDWPPNANLSSSAPSGGANTHEIEIVYTQVLKSHRAHFYDYQNSLKEQPLQLAAPPSGGRDN